MDSTEAQIPTLDDPLIAMISYVGNQVQDELDHNLRSANLSVAQLSTLHLIDINTESVALNELAQARGCVKSNMTQLIDRMVANELVERKRSEEDRRKVLVDMTAKGKRTYEKGMECLKTTENNILSHFSEQQKQQLARLLQKIQKK